MASNTGKSLVCLFVGLLACLPAYADSVGPARVIDGDTLSIDGQVVRLFGIDAPELAQRCDGPKPFHKCGEVAAGALAGRISGKALTCQADDVDKYSRLIATCQINGMDLSAWMVSDGDAIANVKFSDRYVDDETEARAYHKRLWHTAFEPPWRCRVDQCKVAE